MNPNRTADEIIEWMDATYTEIDRLLRSLTSDTSLAERQALSNEDRAKIAKHILEHICKLTHDANTN